MFAILFKYSWVMFIVVTCINAAIYKIRSKSHVDANPDLAAGYAKLIKGYLLWLNIPWVIMGVGCTIGGLPSAFHFFNPQDGNPFVLAWFGSIFMLWILGTYWLFFKKGAEALVKYPGALNHDISSPLVLKLLWCVCLLGGIAGVVMMWTQITPTP